MKDRRVEKGVQRGQSFEIEVDGEKLVAYAGETVAAVLMAAGKRTFGRTRKNGHPRGLYCGIGLCQECLLVIDGQENVQACQTLASPGCRVETRIGEGDAEVRS